MITIGVVHWLEVHAVPNIMEYGIVCSTGEMKMKLLIFGVVDRWVG